MKRSRSPDLCVSQSDDLSDDELMRILDAVEKQRSISTPHGRVNVPPPQVPHDCLPSTQVDNHCGGMALFV